MKLNEYKENLDTYNDLSLLCKKINSKHNTFGGNCGNFALALARELNKQEIYDFDITICSSIYDEDLAECNYNPRAYEEFESSIYHVAININGILFDGNGRTTMSKLKKIAKDEYGDANPNIYSHSYTKENDDDFRFAFEWGTNYDVSPEYYQKLIQKELKVLNESLLLEKTRNQLLTKSKTADNYSPKNQNKGKNRYERRKYSRIARSVAQYNEISMDDLFKKDTLQVGIQVQGETDNYIVQLRFEGVIRELAEEVKRNNGKLEFKNIVKAMSKVFNNGDVFINCSCPDYKYRQSYWATKQGYSIVPELRPSDITNPKDSKGGGCKHILLVLANLDWVMKISSVINNYIKYCQKNLQNAYATYIFPKVYGMPYQKAVQLSLFDDGLLPDDQETLKQVASQNIKNKNKPNLKKPEPIQKGFKKKEEPIEEPSQQEKSKTTGKSPLSTTDKYRYERDKNKEPKFTKQQSLFDMENEE